MNNKPLQIFTAFLDVVNLVIVISSLQLKLNGIITGLSILAILTFSSFWFIEHLRQQSVANINLETPPLSHTDVMMRNSNSRALRSSVEAKIEDWKKQQEQRIQEKNEEYLGREKLVFGLGVVITLIIVYLLAVSQSDIYIGEYPK